MSICVFLHGHGHMSTCVPGMKNRVSNPLKLEFEAITKH